MLLALVHGNYAGWTCLHAACKGEDRGGPGRGAGLTCAGGRGCLVRGHLVRGEKRQEACGRRALSEFSAAGEAGPCVLDGARIHPQPLQFLLDC